jgi:hypothetical protein
MHAVEIASFLDQRISELAKNRLPQEPAYPGGDLQYASFMMPRDEMMNNILEKDNDPSVHSSSNPNGSSYRSPGGHQSNGGWSDRHKPHDDFSRNGENAYVPGLPKF